MKSPTRSSQPSDTIDDQTDDRVVGKYRLLRVIGRGGFGVTYEGVPLEGGGHVAIKELRLSHVDDWKLIELFEREARVLAQVTHPAVPTYVDHFTIQGPSGTVFYLVQELALGQSLESLVIGGWRADESTVKPIALVLLDVLDYLHARTPPVFHRDIKPLNVLLGDNGKVWLVDFGAVRDVYRSTATGGSTVAGTFGYMAPEQLRGVARPESDLYGLGATLLFALSGLSPADMPQRKLRADFRPHVRVSAQFAGWLDRMLEPAPEDRFPSAQQARSALHAPTLPQASAERGHKKRTLALAGVLGGLVVALGGVVSYEARVRATKAFSALPRLPERPAPWSFPAVHFVRAIPAAFSAVMSTRFTPDGERLITGAWDDTAKVWQVRSGETVFSLPGHTMPVAAVRVTPDGRYLATTGDHTVRIWAASDGKLVRTIDVGSRVLSADFAADGNRLASASQDGTVKVWTTDGTLVRTLQHGQSPVLGVAFSPDGSRLASCGDDPAIKVWDAAEGRLLCTLAGHKGPVGAVSIAPDGQILASASDDHSVKLWHIQACRELKTLALHSDEAWSLAFSPDGGTLLTGGKDNVMGVWAIPSTGLRQRVDLGDAKGTLSIAFSRDGVTFATAQGKGAAWIWRLARNGQYSLPQPTIEERLRPANDTQEQGSYVEAMDLVESYLGDRRPLDEAGARLQKMLDGNPRSALALAGLGRVSYKRAHIWFDKYDDQELARARDFANRAIAADPTLVDGHIVRGWTLIAQKDVAGARTEVNTALKIAPRFPRTLLLAAEVATREGDFEQAEKVLRDALSRPINRRLGAAAFESLVEVFEQLGDIDAAEQAYKEYIELQPESAAAKVNFADFLNKKGDWDAAIAMAQKALDQMKYGAAKHTLAAAYCGKGTSLLWDQGDAEGAARAFHSAAEADSSHACAAYGLGAYEQFLSITRHDPDRLADARTWYQAAARLDPESEQARKALASMN